MGKKKCVKKLHSPPSIYPLEDRLLHALQELITEAKAGKSSFVHTSDM